MQTTLLAVGIAIILALLTALVGPFFVNWSDYRTLVESQASRIVGVPVRITGNISARLLPVPSISLRGIEIGDRAAGGTPASTVRADGLDIEFALGGALRGEWRASEVRLVGAEADVHLDERGRLRGIGSTSVMAPESLSIDQLVIREGRLAIWNAGSARAHRIGGVWFTGDARSLIGPFKGEGGFSSGDDRHSFRLSLGRLQESEARLRLTWEAGSRPLSGDAEGMFRLVDGVPGFEGTLRVSRPADVEIAHGRAVNREPWSLTGRVGAAPSGMLFEQIDIQVGAEQRALKLSGSAKLTLGDGPELDAVVSASQLDLDRFVALTESTRRLPLVALRTVAEQLGDHLIPSIPVRIGLSIESLALGGNSVQALRGDLVGNQQGWTVDALEFRAPGFTQVHASGRWAGRASFSGPISIQSVDPRTLSAWLEGRSAAVAAQGPALGRLGVSGLLTVAAGRFALEQLRAEIDKKEVTGLIAYEWGPEQKKPRLEAEVKASELDIDALTQTLRAAIPGFGMSLPAEISLAVEVDRASIAGMQLKDTSAKLALHDGNLAIERFSIRDLSGSSISVAGGIEDPWGKPRGSMLIVIAGDRIDGLAAVAETFFPRSAEPLKKIAERLGRSELQVALEIEEKSGDSADGSTVRMRVDGSAGGAEISFRGSFAGNPGDWSSGSLSVDGRMDAKDGRKLMRLLNMNEAFEVDAGPGSFDWSVSGKLAGSLPVRARLRAPGLSAVTKGELQVKEGGLSGSGELTVEARNVPALRSMGGSAVPLRFSGGIGLEPDRMWFDHATVSSGDMVASGRLAVWFGDKPRVEGHLDANSIDALALVAAAAGVSAGDVMPADDVRSRRTIWSGQPFDPGLFSALIGKVELRAATAKLADWPDIHEFGVLLRFGETGVSLEKIRGTFAGGRLAAHIEFAGGEQGTSADIRLSLNEADLAQLSPAKSPALVRGRMSLQLEAKGLGRSPASLAGALGGAGTASFKDVELTRLDPEVFEAVTRATDAGTDVDPVKVLRLANSALERGRLRIDSADGTLTLVAGQLRLGSMLAKGEKADLTASGSFDILKGVLDARLALMGHTGSDAPAAGRPEIFVALRGEPDRVERTVDVSTLVGWLTLRAVDLQAKRLEALEAERRALRAQDSSAAAGDAGARPAAIAPLPGAGGRLAPHPSNTNSPAPKSPPVIIPHENGRRSPAMPSAGSAADQRASIPSGSEVPKDPPAGERPVTDAHGRQSSKTPPATPSSEPSSQNRPATTSEPAAAQAPPLPPPIQIVPAPRPRSAESAAAGRRSDRSGEALPPPPPATFNPLRWFDLFGAAR